MRLATFEFKGKNTATGRYEKKTIRYSYDALKKEETVLIDEMPVEMKRRQKYDPTTLPKFYIMGPLATWAISESQFESLHSIWKKIRRDERYKAKIDDYYNIRVDWS